MFYCVGVSRKAIDMTRTQGNNLCGFALHLCELFHMLCSIFCNSTHSMFIYKNKEDHLVAQSLQYMQFNCNAIILCSLICTTVFDWFKS